MGKRKRLLDSAIALFAVGGIDQTTTADVARKAGVAAGTLFNYFPTKEELIRSSYLECKTEMARALQEGIDFAADFEIVLERLWTQSVNWCLQNSDCHGFMRQFSHSPYSRDEELKKQVQNEFCFLTEVLEQGMRKGKVVGMPIDFLDMVLLSLFEITVDYLRQVEDKDRPALIEMSFRLLQRALSAKL